MMGEDGITYGCEAMTRILACRNSGAKSAPFGHTKRMEVGIDTELFEEVDVS